MKWVRICKKARFYSKTKSLIHRGRQAGNERSNTGVGKTKA